MTFEEYNKAMDTYAERIENGEDILDEVTDFQYKYMNSVLASYNADTPAKKICRDILEYAVNYSQYGSCVQYIEDRELAESVNDIIWEEIGEYMLETPEYYEENGTWVIDCIFAGYYVPGWDGWDEEEWEE